MKRLPDIPARRGSRRRDRHGRGPRGPLLSPALPAWRSRAEQFDDTVALIAGRLTRANPQLNSVEFAVEEVPPSDPSPWEFGQVALGRTFPQDRTTKTPARIVVYRRPILTRSESLAESRLLIHDVLLQQVAGLLGTDPIDPDAPRR